MKFQGDIELLAGGAGQIKNAHIEKGTTNPTDQSSNNSGRLFFNTTDGLFYYYNGTAWVTFATGGDATAVQNELNSVEATLGSLVNADGTTNVAAALTNTYFGGATNLTTALMNLASAVTAHDTLAELGDVTFGTLVNNDVLSYDSVSGEWINEAPGSGSGIQPYDADLTTIAGFSHVAGQVIYDTGAAWAVAGPGATSGVQAWDAGLDALAAAGTGLVSMDGNTVNFRTLTAPAAGLTVSNGTGVSGDPTIALANDLAAVEGLSTTGIAIRTAADTWATRTLTAPAAGFTITNPAGLAGNPTFALANDLAALEGLITTGYVVRTGDGTAATRTFAVVAGELVITGDAAGVSTDTTFGLATVTDSGTGTFVKIARDGFGRVTGTTAVVTADITALVDATYVNITGDTMTGNLVMSGATVTGLPAPTGATDATNKAYVDAAVAGLSWKQSVSAASIGNVVLAPAPATIDGVTLTTNMRVLLKDQTAPAENGIYTFNGTDLVRSTDMDVAGEFAGATVFVTQGTTNSDSGWTQTAEVVTLGTTAVTWAQFSGSATYTWGTGLTAAGNTINVNLGAGIVDLPSDEVGIDLYDEPNGALILTTDGTAHSTVTGAKLYLKLDAAGALAQTASGLKVADNSVTNAMIVNDSWTLNGDTGAVTFDLGDTFEVKGNATQGIVTSVATTGTVATFTVTASTATSSQLGVAKFNTGDFDVTAGDVTIKLAGVDNNQLANSTITIAASDDASSDPVALGETLTFTGTDPIDVAVTANTVTISAKLASTSVIGVASFNADQFSVTAGAVSLAATLSDLTDVDTSTDAPAQDSILAYDAGTWKAVDPTTVLDSASIDDLSDVVITSAVDGQALINNGTNWVNQKIYYTETFTAAASWTVTHNIGQKFVNVTVYDSTDNVVIPQSIVATSTTVTTITFNSSVAGTAVIMGIA